MSSESLLASDMDGTVIPMGEGIEWEEDITAFRKAVNTRPHLRLAYVTGRDLDLAVQGIEHHRLPQPRLLVCDVGTSLYHVHGDRYRPDEGYAERMREAVDGLEAREIREGVGCHPGLSLQPDDRQTPFKVSYYLSPKADHSTILTFIESRLEPFRGRVQAVYSVQAPDGVGLVDLLPAGVAKDFALRYLHELTGVGAERTVYAGDSGNDLAAMLTGFNTIVVGNADGALKREVRRRAEREGVLDRVYFSERPFAGGVLEGCRHFELL